MRIGRAPARVSSERPDFSDARITPAVATTIASAISGVRGSPKTTRPKTAMWTGSVFVVAVTTEKERSRIAASMSAVARICVTAPMTMKPKKPLPGPGRRSPETASTIRRNSAAKGSP